MGQKLGWSVSEDRSAELSEGRRYALYAGDPCVQKIGDEFIMEGTHVKKRANEKIESFFAYFHRGTDIHDLHYFATGPDNMKDVRLVPLQDGRIGVFPGRGEKRCLKSTETKR